MMLRSICVVILALATASTWAADPARATIPAREVRIGVLGLFHPRQIVISPAAGQTLECMAGAERLTARASLPLVLQLAAPGIWVDGQPVSAKTIQCNNGRGQDAEFVVSIPRRISRRYFGRIEIQPGPGELFIIVTMGLETAVASVVAAEALPGAP